ncbi:ribonuclease HII [Candidatus Woesearchaeota archaeon B3_Woes]|nr:MAG: ribonuclease HII [Candidatus Woesearchaeota archaeon B3_Woes]
MLLCGIDEAGRGPVIGPLVMAGVVIEEKDISKLESIGVKDSKLLTINERNSLFDKVKKIVKSYEIVVLSSKDVDDVLNSKDMNLNLLEGKTSAEIVNNLKPDKAILDCPSTNVNAYSNYVKDLLKKDVKLIVEHKADLNYVIVGAASILAKVTRDSEIEKIKKKININFGSGYPSDPRTQEFLKKNWNKYPDIFRKTWASYKNVVKGSYQKKMSEF